MRASAVLFTLFAALAAAAPSGIVETEHLLEARQCQKAGVCSKGGDNGTFCSNLKCCSDSKSGRGGAVCCCN
ncbi:hypothetical protein Cob_v008888 [Colletotrichum orbiculare MAFF 240422]|uniref:Uncharacterized protein n=1 Tax=Colletotrichum orbiculare (strain 104-T / ATCC 96160 / CBS 514.97 / LARS 414 / MAFF 240422) TaxID=1213857 RepID=N4V5K3_COLOR|nr:hypothetical protein Cob_v008888 [Colletotrichum orbiculare MAFF 240422]